MALVAIIFFMRSCDGGKTITEPKIITKTETKWDTINVVKEVYVPKWKTKIVTQIDSILINTPIDTLEVLKDYYAKNVFIDEISLDSLGIITITDTITDAPIIYKDLKLLVVLHIFLLIITNPSCVVCDIFRILL